MDHTFSKETIMQNHMNPPPRSPDLWCSASVIGTKAPRATSGGSGSHPLPEYVTEFYPGGFSDRPVVAPATGTQRAEFDPTSALIPWWGVFFIGFFAGAFVTMPLWLF